MPSDKTEDKHDLLPFYYSNLFPADHMFSWLSYGKEETFSKREFSFTLENDVYLRYQSFSDAKSMVQQLIRQCPVKIDIGAIYNQCPRKRDVISATFQPVEKEFVLDIDLTDYDEVRNCCSGAQVCVKCWKFIGVAVAILNRALRQDFGFRHLLWVFSGRRGVHCWVADEVARKLDYSGRSAVIDYLSVVKGGSEKSRKVKLPSVNYNVHPAIQKALKIIEKYCDEICDDDQKVLDSATYFQMLPGIIQDKIKTSSNRWQSAKESIAAHMAKEPRSNYQRNFDELKLQLCYPRIDINVSTGMNHLLKSPFCVHPKTGMICVPFDPRKVFLFNPAETPTLRQLQKEVDEYDKSTNCPDIECWKKTSIKPYMETFLTFARKLETNNFKVEERF